MKTKELIEYLQGFDAESEVVVIAANPKERKKRVIVSTVDERTEQQCLERRHNLATEEKVRTGAWMNMQQ